LHYAIEFLNEGHNIQDLAKHDVGSAAVVVKFFKGLTIYRSLVREPRVQPPKVFWFYGKTGTGKTRTAMAMGDRFGDRPNDILISSGPLQWFPGYDGQSVAIIDDFRAKHVSSFAFLLRLLDRYPTRVEFKGGHADWAPKIVIITSSYSPDECFSVRNVYQPEDMAQLHRRITREYHFEDTHDTERIALLLEYFDNDMGGEGDQRDNKGI